MLVILKCPAPVIQSEKKKDYDAKISDVYYEYFRTSDYNRFMNCILDVKMKSKLVNGSNISGFVKNTDLDGKIKKINNNNKKN